MRRVVLSDILSVGWIGSGAGRSAISHKREIRAFRHARSSVFAFEVPDDRGRCTMSRIVAVRCP